MHSDRVAQLSLHADLKEELLKIVPGMKKVVFVESNSRSDDGFFRDPRALSDVVRKAVWNGSLDL
jgi:hypothetical protein